MSTASEKAGPAVPKEYLGMLEYKKDDEGRLVRTLILGNFHSCSLYLYVGQTYLLIIIHVMFD